MSKKRAYPTEAEIEAKARVKARTRAKILAAAQAVFFKDGYSANLDTIAATAGVARTTLFNQFSSKDQLFWVVVNELFQRLFADIEHVSADLPLDQALLHFGRAYVRMAVDPNSVALTRLTFADLGRFPELGLLAYRAGYAHSVPLLAAYLEAQMQKGTVRPLDPTRAAERFFAAATGSVRHRLLHGVAADDAARSEQSLLETVEIFTKGMS